MIYKLWDMKWDVESPRYRESLPTEGTFCIDADSHNKGDDTVNEIRKNLTERFACPLIDFDFDFAETGVKAFTVCIKKVDCLFVNVMATSLDQAIERVEKRAYNNDWFANWNWDGMDVSVSREDSHEAPGEDVDF